MDHKIRKEQALSWPSRYSSFWLGVLDIFFYKPEMGKEVLFVIKSLDKGMAGPAGAK